MKNITLEYSILEDKFVPLIWAKDNNSEKEEKLFADMSPFTRFKDQLFSDAEIKENAEKLVKCWNEYDKLKEENSLLIEALQNIINESEDKSVEMNTPIAYFKYFDKAKELLNKLKK